MDEQTFTSLVEWLNLQAKTIREIEQKADEALHQNADDHTYRNLMKEKARILSGLAENASTYVVGLPETERGTVSDSLARFSSSASAALRIDSTFYMSALLYPEDYTAGSKNDLERFIDKITSMFDPE